MLMRTHHTPRHSREHIHAPRTLGERAADRLASFAGSWKFIIGQTIFIAVWIVLNSVAFLQHWDPYPWILLNLCMSTQAMYTGPIVMLSQNRAAQKDRQRDDLEADEVELLVKLNEEQLEILRLLHQLLESGSVPIARRASYIARLVALIRARVSGDFVRPRIFSLIARRSHSGRTRRRPL